MYTVQALRLEVAAAVGGVSRWVAERHRLQDLAVVGVGGRDPDDGQSGRVRQDVHPGTPFTSAHGARTCECAPVLARGLSRGRRGRGRGGRRRRDGAGSPPAAGPHAPALDQVRNRWWAVGFDIPKQCGIARRAQPLTGTWMIAANSVSSGYAISHNPSGTIPAPRTPPHEQLDVGPTTRPQRTDRGVELVGAAGGVHRRSPDRRRRTPSWRARRCPTPSPNGSCAMGYCVSNR